jgi:translocation and assembly module TamB
LSPLAWRSLFAGRRLIAIAAGAALLCVAGLALRVGPATPLGHALIADLASGQRVGSLGWLRVADVGGDPWSAFSIGRFEIADARGPWLSAEGIAVRWRPAGLLERRLSITDLSARSITVLRAPALLPPRPSSRSPISVRIDRVAAVVTLDSAFADRRGDYRVDASADVGRRDDLKLRADATSLTHPGDFLRVALAFDKTAISLEAHAREAQGGALGGGLGLDPTQPFRLDAGAHGAPSAGWFSVTTAVGGATPAQATGKWSAAGGEATGRIDLAASRWLSPWRRRLGPTASFDLTADRAAAGLYAVKLAVGADTLRLTAAGQIDPAHRRTGPEGLALALTSPDVATLAAQPGLGAGEASGRLTGDDHSWRLAGAASIRGLQAAGFTLAGVSGPVTLTFDRGALSAHAEALGAGGSGSGPAAILLGRSPRGSVDVQWRPRGGVLLRRLTLQGAALDVQGQGEIGLFGGLTFTGQARAHDLAAAAAAIGAPPAKGSPVAGLITADWKASQRQDGAPWVFSLDARGRALRLGTAETDAVVGAAPRLRAAGRYAASGLTLDHADLQGAGGALSGAGLVGSAGDLRLDLAWTGAGPLRLGPLAVSGGSKGAAQLGGTLGRPRLQLDVDMPTLEIADLQSAKLDHARLNLTLAGDGAGFGGHVGLTGQMQSHPARAESLFRLANQQASLSDLDIEAGGARLRGAATAGGQGPALADLTLSVGPGLLLERGRADGSVHIVAGPGGGRAKIAVKGVGLVFPGEGAALDSLTLSADGPLSHLPYQVDARGQAGGVAGRVGGAGQASLAGGRPTVSFEGAGRVAGTDVRTLAPAVLVLGAAGARGDLRLGVGTGRADLTVTDGAGGLAVKAVAAGLDIGLLGTDLRGRADGELTLASRGGALVGGLQARVEGLTGRQVEGAASMAGSLEADLGGDTIGLRARLTSGQGARLSADVRLPATLSGSPLRLALDTGRPISGTFAADAEVGPLWDLLEGGGQTLTGRLAASGTIGGTIADPRLFGEAALTGGDFEDGSTGLGLKALTLRADLKGDAVDIAQFSAGDGARGAISGSGRLSLERGGASAFRLALKGFRLIDSALVQATASGAVDVSRAADGKVRLAGALTIDQARVSPTPPTPSGVVAMDVVEVRGAAAASAAAVRPPEREAPVDLDITLKAPGGLVIKGRGLNMEMSLDAKVTGTTASPALSGAARVLRGDYDFAGERFQIEDGGAVYLGATPETIRLDLTATRDNPTLTAVVRIEGTAAVPKLTLSSTPALPQDDILSQVLFGASPAQLSGIQAAQLASAVAGLAGNGGFDVIAGLRNFAHLDRLAIDTDATTGASLAGGKYVSNKVYVELQSGARIGQGAQVEWRVRKHLSIVSRVTSQGDNALSVRWRKDY